MSAGEGEKAQERGIRRGEEEEGRGRKRRGTHVCLFRVIPVSTAEGHVGRDPLLREIDDDGYYCAGLYRARAKKNDQFPKGVDRGASGPSTQEIWNEEHSLISRWIYV